MFLVYGGDEELVVKDYVDASFDTDPDDSKSRTGYVYILNGGAVSWRSCKQSVIAGSTTEAEYMAASEASSEGVWIRNFITELVWFQVPWIHWRYCARTLAPKHWLRNQDIIQKPSTSTAVSI
jgi:hypothetical protein